MLAVSSLKNATQPFILTKKRVTPQALETKQLFSSSCRDSHALDIDEDSVVMAS